MIYNRFSFFYASMVRQDLNREPCPDRIVDDIGGAFGMGLIGSFFWNFCKGARNSPRGERFLSGIYNGRNRAPITGNSFAQWGTIFACTDCTLLWMRQTDDHLNKIGGGFITGGVLTMRNGWKAAGKSAVIGGVLLAVIESVMAVFSRWSASNDMMPAKQLKKMREHEKYVEVLAAAQAQQTQKEQSF